MEVLSHEASKRGYTSDINQLPDNSNILLTPGPLTTSGTVKAVMLRDWVMERIIDSL